MLLLPIGPDAQKNVMEGILRFSMESDDKIREGFLDRLKAIQENSNVKVMLLHYDAKENDKQPGFDLSWYPTDKETWAHPQETQQRPYMVGGLILHASGEWGMHT